MPFVLDQKRQHPASLLGATIQSADAFEVSSLDFVAANGHYAVIQQLPSSVFDPVSTGDFTVEFRLRLKSVGGNLIVYDMRPNGATGVYIAIYTSNGSIRYYVSGGDRITGSTLSSNTWYHIAICRASGTTRMFVDGVQVGASYADSNIYLNNFIQLGQNNSNQYLNGIMDHVRFTAFARYTTTFTPPTTMDDTDPYWSSVLLLYKFDSAAQTHHAGYPIIDDAIDLTNYFYQTPQPFTTPRRLAGVVKENGVAVGAGKRVVAMTRVTMQYVGSCVTKSDGSFEMTMLEDRTGNPEKLFVVAFDDDGIDPNFNAVLADKLLQVV